VEEAPTPTPAPLADAPGVELIAGWLLTGMSDDAGETQPLPDNAAIILTFDTGGNFNGFAGCNNYAGVFSVLPGQKLVLKQSQLTEMTCDAPEGVMDLERAYLQRLAEVDRYQVDEDGVLQLGTPSGAKLSFVRGTARSAKALSSRRGPMRKNDSKCNGRLSSASAQRRGAGLIAQRRSSALFPRSTE